MSDVSDFSSILLVDSSSVTIPQGTALSNSFDLIGTSLVGIVIPSDWTIADVSLQVSYDNGITFIDHYDNTGAETVFTVAGVNRVVSFGSNTIAKLVSARLIKLRSGTTSAPDNQLGSDKIIKLLSRPF